MKTFQLAVNTCVSVSPNKQCWNNSGQYDSMLSTEVNFTLNLKTKVLPCYKKNLLNFIETKFSVS